MKESEENDKKRKWKDAPVDTARRTQTELKVQQIKLFSRIRAVSGYLSHLTITEGKGSAT